MIIFQRPPGDWILTTLAVALLLAPGTLACAPSEGNLSTQEKSELIVRLRAARELDLRYAHEVSVGPVAAGDFMLRAERAEDVIAELERGVEVSRAEANDALFVPPKSLSESERARLVQRLEQARRLDDRGWWDWTRDPVIAQKFLIQEKKTDRVIKDLETGQPVSWFDIETAMQVPDNP